MYLPGDTYGYLSANSSNGFSNDFYTYLVKYKYSLNISTIFIWNQFDLPPHPFSSSKIAFLPMKWCMHF